MKTINGQDLKQLFLSGANNLFNHYPEIDQLNVFPVPDGDTGMNMNLTMTSGAKEIQNRNDTDISEIAKAFSKGLLMGARGNSGVITSQIFKGFSVGIEGKQQITVREMVDAFISAKEVAYKAVMKPVEGTILTVIRESSSALVERIKKDTSFETALDILLEEAKKSLDHTPDLLPILKEVGVVDSGGAGLCVIFEGMAKAAHGKFVERIQLDAGQTNDSAVLASPYAGAKISEDEEGYGYCTQFILRLGGPNDGKKPFIEKRFQNFLSGHGNSIVLVRDDDIVKVHVHTLTPGTMLNYAQNYGEFLTITIENMSEEHHNIENGAVATDMAGNIERAKAEKAKEEPYKEYGLIAVSSGSGLDEMFKELGVDVIVGGGQTMNPSTEDFVKALEKVHAKHVFIYPNNSNIVMAASQACEVIDNTKTVGQVVPSKTILQGITSLMQFSPDLSPEDNFDNMKSALKDVKSGSVTYAIKDTDIDGVHITKDYYMAMADDKSIISCVPDKYQSLNDIIDALVDEDSYMITVIYGQDVSANEEKEIKDALEEKYPDLDIDVKNGGQPVYSFLIGVE
ncbi:MAG: DAK2 domain-containing protein [Bacilli bacterium]|nr:DAK2 domain-containing protein [Bacilli bacterium]